VGFYEGRKAHIVKNSILLLCMLVIAGCATSSNPGTDQLGTRQIHANAVLHQGPEVAAVLVHPSGKKSLGEEWLVLATEVTAARGGGAVVIYREEISLRTPDGHRLPLISQGDFRGNYPKFKIPVERTLAYLPLLDRYEFSRVVPCERWFLTAPPQLLAFDDIPLSSSQICSGPLVFKVPGAVQPGRWRLIIELEESRVDIPFELYTDE
jgi:hypothetical protein